jgi:hypothetical protein
MVSRGGRIVGVDFDNTLVVYDDLLRAMALERGLIAAGAARSKREIRDAVRRLPDGETHWQRLQAAAYGPRIGEARLAEGVAAFLDRCARASVRVCVVSHKTELAGYDETGTNLRQAAVAWMQARGLFALGALDPEAVFFGATRAEKIAQIRSLGCTHFVDDLEETFLEDGFPAAVEKILYAPYPPAQVPPGVRVAQSWREIGGYLFGA